MENITRQNRILKAGLVIMIIVNSAFFFFSFSSIMKKEKFEEIDAERINIIGANGKPVMVLSNKKRIPGVSMNGKNYPKEFSDGRQLYSGIIFLNEEGDEVGGLIYNGFPMTDTTYFALEHLSFDQWKQNQVVAMQYIDNSRSRRAGLRVWDRPDDVTIDEMFDRYLARSKFQKDSPQYDSITREIEASRERGDNGIERMFIGSLNDVAQIQMRDSKGIVRIRMYIDEYDNAKLEFLDVEGEVVKSF